MARLVDATTQTEPPPELRSLIQGEAGRGTDPRLFINLQLNDVRLYAMLDTGSIHTHLGKGLSKIFEEKLRSHEAIVQVGDGTPVDVQGIMNVQVQLGKVRRTVPFRVTDELLYDCILGVDFMRAFQMSIDSGNDTWWLPDGELHQFHPYKRDPHWFPAIASLGGLIPASQIQQTTINKLLDELIPPPPAHLGVTPLYEYKIDVQGHEPIRQRNRRYSPKMLAAGHAEVDRMLAEGIIEPSDSPWCSCPVIVPKANGKWRFCIDYRKVNAVTKKLAYPMRNMDDILDMLRCAKYISKLDLSQAYHQIPLEKSCREITAFSMPGRGLFQFTRLPYGLTNAPSLFQRIMDKLIQPDWEPHVFAYLDDVIIVTATFAEHIYWLRKVLTALKEANLQLNREKSEFVCSEVQYLGYLVNQHGLKTDQDKVQPIIDYPAPTNIRQLRRFLGMIGWYSRFIKGLAEYRVPLTKLLKKDVRWHWQEEQETAFLQLKLALTQAPVLARPDFSKPFTLQTDASDYAVAGVLTQEVEGEEHPIYYVSRTLTKPERNYTVTEKECLAVLWAVDRLQGYLRGEKFRVITDHHSLLWLNNLKDPSGRLARWNTTLQAYDIEFVHRKGAHNKVPDALSRACENTASGTQNTSSLTPAPASSIHPAEIAALGEILTDDPWYTKKKQQVTKWPSRYPDLKIENGLLYAHRPNKWIDPIIQDLDAWKLLLPAANRERALYEAHDEPQSGHLGVEKTYARLATYYYWPGCFYDTSCYVKACQECQRHKPDQRPPAGLMNERYVEGPWVVVAADIMGPKPPSKRGFRYIIVFEDIFTKYVEIKALRKADAKSVLEAFEELIINRWGCPQYLLTDNGTEFSNKMVTERLALYGIQQTTIVPYHAQANPVERVNKTLRAMINSYLTNDHREWDEHLKEFSFALNNMVHSSTKISPAFLNFGRNPVPTALVRKHLDNPQPLRPSDSQTWSDRLKRLPAIFDLVKRNLDKAATRQAKYYNQHRREVSYSVGDQVLRRNHVLSSAADNFAAKQAPLFVGPATIVKAISPSVYLVEDRDSKKLMKVHVKDLKRHVPPRTPALPVPEPVSDGLPDKRPRPESGAEPIRPHPAPIDEPRRRRGRPPKMGPKPHAAATAGPGCNPPGDGGGRSPRGQPAQAGPWLRPRTKRS